jgi:ankyrin repeat protein
MIEGCNALLHYAAAYCDRDIILNILQQGADIMAEDSEQRLPLEMAISYKNSKCDFLLQKQYLHCCGACAGARETFFSF